MTGATGVLIDGSGLRRQSRTVVVRTVQSQPLIDFGMVSSTL